MKPRIQYATNSDGVSIAYWTLDGGKPVVRGLRLIAITGELERAVRTPEAAGERYENEIIAVEPGRAHIRRGR